MFKLDQFRRNVRASLLAAARPHGWVLEVDSRTIQVGGHRGFVVVKKNYNGDNLSIAEVERDRSRYLDSISVMFRREPGYDPDEVHLIGQAGEKIREAFVIDNDTLSMSLKTLDPGLRRDGDNGINPSCLRP